MRTRSHTALLHFGLYRNEPKSSFRDVRGHGKHRLCLWLVWISLLLSHAASQTLPLEGAVNGVHDPVMIAEDGKFYVFSTGPGVPIRCSEDMTTWRLCSAVFISLPLWIYEAVPAVGDLWAPDIAYHNGRYLLYYSASSFGDNQSLIGLASNTTLDPNSPDYAWQDEGIIIASQRSNHWNAIDPNFVVDAEGQAWLTFGSFWSGIKLIKLDAQGHALEEQPELLAIAARPGSTAIEAPFIIHRDDFYYLFVSFDACCRGVDSSYHIRVGRAAEISGPYFDKEGRALLAGGGTLLKIGGERWRGTGHNAIFQHQGQDYLLYHAYDRHHNGAPYLNIEPMNWQDGWPVILEQRAE